MNNGETIEYALGVSIGEENGLKKISHGGADAGFRTYLSYYPELDAGMIILANSAGFSGRMVAQDVASAFFGEYMVKKTEKEKAKLNNTDISIPPAPKPKQELWKPTQEELSLYTGRYYSDELDTFYVISIEDSRLKISHTRHGDNFLTAKEKDVFSTNQWYLGEFMFNRSKDHKVEQVSISNGRVRNLTLDKINL